MTYATHTSLGRRYPPVAVSLRLSRCLLQPNDVADLGVREGDDDERNEVLQHHEDNAVDVLVTVTLPHLPAQPTRSVVAFVLHSGHDGGGQRHGQGQEPDEGRHLQESLLCCPPSEWVDDGHEPVRTDGHQGEGAEEDCHHLHVGHEGTHELPERPPQQDQVGHKGEGIADDGLHDVTDGQVEEEEIGDGTHGGAGKYDVAHQDVPAQRHDDNKGVHENDDHCDVEWLALLPLHYKLTVRHVARVAERHVG